MPYAPSVAISDRTRKILWASAGGRCSKCRVLLVTEGTETDEPSIIGEEAHIISEAPGGPRHAYLRDYDCYENLILLCRNHHKPADDQFNHYTVEELRRLKREHEGWVEGQGRHGDDPIRVVPDPAYPIPKILNLCMTGAQLWHVMQGAHAFYPSWPDNLTEEQNDLIATFLDSIRDWMDMITFDDSYQSGRDAAKHLDEQIKGLNQVGLFIGGRRRRCLITGGVRAPEPRLVLDVEIQPIRDAELVDGSGHKVWPTNDAAARPGSEAVASQDSDEHAGRGHDQRWMKRRRTVYTQYLAAVRPWFHHVRHWTGPYWEPDSTTKESLHKEEGSFDHGPISDEMARIEEEILLIGSDGANQAVQWFHAQLLAFEATVIVGELDIVTNAGRYCENAYDWLSWAFRADLGILGPEPSVKPTGQRLTK